MCVLREVEIEFFELVLGAGRNIFVQDLCNGRGLVVGDLCQLRESPQHPPDAGLGDARTFLQTDLAQLEVAGLVEAILTATTTTLLRLPPLAVTAAMEAWHFA